MELIGGNNDLFKTCFIFSSDKTGILKRQNESDTPSFKVPSSPLLTLAICTVTSLNNCNISLAFCAIYSPSEVKTTPRGASADKYYPQFFLNLLDALCQSRLSHKHQIRGLRYIFYAIEEKGKSLLHKIAEIPSKEFVVFNFDSVPFFDNHTHLINCEEKDRKQICWITVEKQPMEMAMAFYHGLGDVPSAKGKENAGYSQNKDIY